MAVLVRFGELLAGVVDRSQVLRELTRTAIDHIGAKAAVVVEISADGGTHVGAQAGVDAELGDFGGDVDAFGPELGDELLARCPTLRGDHAVVVPLASGGGLFGSVVFVFPKGDAVDEDRLELARAVTGLAASGLAQAARFEELSRSYAELRASREVLERSQKLRALGEMAAGVSHDLKNILNPLSLHIQFLERVVAKDSTDARESLAEMKGVLTRGLQTIERLRDFSRQSPSAKVELVDLPQLVSEAIKICRPRMRSSDHDIHYRIVEQLEPAPPVRLSSGEAIAAVVNLIVNAIDAMPTGGTITVRTGTVNGEALVEVADDGPGMPPEVESRVFEPFFTTKGQEGTGLGLAMVYAFVQRNRGHIQLTTGVGKGARFTIAFPAAS